MVATSDPGASLCPDCGTGAGGCMSGWPHVLVICPGRGPGHCGMAQAALEVRQPGLWAGDVHRGGRAAAGPGAGDRAATRARRGPGGTGGRAGINRGGVCGAVLADHPPGLYRPGRSGAGGNGWRSS